MACNCDNTLITSIEECIQKCSFTMSTDCIIHKTELECLEITGTVNLTSILTAIDNKLCSEKYFQATDVFTYSGEDSITALEFTYCPDQEFHIVAVYVNGLLIPTSGWTYLTDGKCRVNLVTPFGALEYAQMIYWVQGSPTLGVYNTYELGV